MTWDCRLQTADWITKSATESARSEICNPKSAIVMDFYVILGVERGATLADIKRAYKRLARKFHPDINPGDRMAAAQFRQIAEAYETLSDPERRQQLRHDRRAGRCGRRGSTFGFDGFDFSVSVHGNEASDLRRSVRRRAASAGRAARRRVRRSAASICTSRSRSTSKRRCAAASGRSPSRGRSTAATCQGAGRLPRHAERRCAHCHGTGAVKSARGHMVFSKPCLHCGGTGQQRQTRCPACGGEQCRDADRDADDRTCRPGWPTARGFASRARDTSAATAARPATSTSTSRVQPHPMFRRDGDDLHVTVPIAIHEAALGAKIDVPSLDGPARVRVPPGTQSGQRFRLRERGVAVAARRPARRSRRRSAAGAAEAARRAIEGAAAGVRPDQRRGRRRADDREQDAESW